MARVNMTKSALRNAKLLLSAVGLSILTAFAPPAHAEGRVGGALITELSVTATAAWVHFDQVIGGPSRPACIGAGWGNEFMFDPNTTLGKVWLTHIETAMLAGKKVDVSGDDRCLNNQAEILRYIKVHAN
jgi:hypothetical protein